jgi:guanosine-3',5'-bis(diphosphate) 3'-pyrophosphohydrolase
MATPRRRNSRNLTRLPVEPRPGIGLEDIFERLRESGRGFDEEGLRRVYEYSLAKHGDQVRASGEPYVTHPLYVAYLLAELGFDETCVAVGLLHDVLEDTLAGREELRDEFGDELARLVDGVTKIGRHAYVQRDEAQAETFRKLILASAEDIRVILVKLADRLHNMMTLQHLEPESRVRIGRETLEIYAPIALRLGMSRLQGDLQDLAFYHLYPKQFADLEARVQERLKIGRSASRKISDRLQQELREADIEAEISSRVKRYYSIFSKLRRQGIDISQLYDYLAYRVVTGSVRDCYAALGVVHQSWRPVPGRFKDYIAMPKPNLYQSIHTTVLSDSGQPFEVQIRTREMDLVAEAGIAAHWRYKAGREATAGDQNIVWLRQLIDWQQEIDDPRAFMSALKIDLYPHEVYCFTPKGDVLTLPRGATPLDFAYKIHTELGHHCVGARVNGKLVPLKTALRNGDIVEIRTSPGRVPSRDWLSFVATSRARSKIRNWLNTEQKKRAMEIGRRMLERELRKHKLNPKKILAGEKLAGFLVSEGLASNDDLFSRIGFGKLAPRAVLDRVLNAEQLAVEAEEPSALRQAVAKMLPFGSSPVTVRGSGDLLTFLAKCCSPLPGEEIVGYITRGRGVSVHSVECSNVRNLLYHPDREIEVEWARQDNEVFPIMLNIETEDEPGMLARLTEVIARLDGNIRHIEATTPEPGLGQIDVVVEVRNRRHLEKLRQALRGVSGVREVDRQMGGATG